MIASKQFYSRYTPAVARDLAGCFLMCRQGNKLYKGMIIETEAYRGTHDLGCHASKGKTTRNAVMFGGSGHAYIYLIYGMYWMLNIVTEHKGYPAAVLIRCVLCFDENNKKTLLDGPGKLTKKFCITKRLNGCDMTKKQKLWIETPENKRRRKIIKMPRIGIGYARHCKHWRWNFRLEI
ncbi:MAG: DNA-3-methyladenine glycosylase [Patescibacteria group bacterium]|nr:DNA-3-methyladenine glycosylase [Patescibacteria group bacterium]